MVPSHVFQLYSPKNDYDDFCAWVPHGYHEKENFFFHEKKPNVLVDCGVLITNMRMIPQKTLLFSNWPESYYQPYYSWLVPLRNRCSLTFSQK